MKSLANAALLTFGLLAAGTAFATDSHSTKPSTTTGSGGEVNANVGEAYQFQKGSHNNQKLDVGVIQGSGHGISKVNVNAKEIIQIQKGSHNNQSAKIGVINKGTGSAKVDVSVGTVYQDQKGQNNNQKMNIGVIK